MSKNIYDSITVGSLFSGIGGFCKGFELAGARIIWANDNDKNAAESYKKNFKHRFILKDIQNLSVEKDQLEPVDIITAGFPCQPFSVAGYRKGFEDVRGRLFFEIIRIIKEFKGNKPKILLLENVKNFLNHNNGETFNLAKKVIQEASFWFDKCNSKILNTRKYTIIPHNRERLFMIALLKDSFDKNDFNFPKKIKSTRLVKEFLNLEKKAEDKYYYTEESQYYNLFHEAIEKGAKDTFYQLRRIYVRENKSKTCPTLTANMGLGGHNIPVIKDKWGIRKLTPLECGRFQGFSDKFLKNLSKIANTSLYKQIGNAVTVPLAKKLADECMTRISSIKNINIKEAV